MNSEITVAAYIGLKKIQARYCQLDLPFCTVITCNDIRSCPTCRMRYALHLSNQLTRHIDYNDYCSTIIGGCYLKPQKFPTIIRRKLLTLESKSPLLLFPDIRYYPERGYDIHYHVLSSKSTASEISRLLPKQFVYSKPLATTLDRYLLYCMKINLTCLYSSTASPTRDMIIYEWYRSYGKVELMNFGRVVSGKLRTLRYLNNYVIKSPTRFNPFPSDLDICSPYIFTKSVLPPDINICEDVYLRLHSPQF